MAIGSKLYEVKDINHEIVLAFIKGVKLDVIRADDLDKLDSDILAQMLNMCVDKRNSEHVKEISKIIKS